MLGAGDYFHGSTTLLLRPARFKNMNSKSWSSEELNLSSESSIEITMLSNYEISANFQPITLSSISGVEDLGSIGMVPMAWLFSFHQ